MNPLPDAPSCRRNQQPILDVIKPWLKDKKSLLEVGSGTGQHAVWFGEKLPHLSWQTSDLPENLPGINGWIKQSGLDNVLPPLALDVTQAEWESGGYDAVFTANTLHIMPAECSEHFFRGCAQVLNKKGLIFIYGPFKYQGQFTSISNADFDIWLKARTLHQGIRDIERIIELAGQYNFSLINDIDMPANNQILIFSTN